MVIRSHKNRLGLAGQQSFAFARPATQSTPQPTRRRRRRGRIRNALKQCGLFLLVALMPLFAWVWVQGYVAAGLERAKSKLVAVSVDAGFKVEMVRASGQVRTSDDAIMEALGVQAGDPLFALDMSTLGGRIEALPWVGKASVTRELPSTLQIWIYERTPFVRWQIAGEMMLVDSKGMKIAGADLTEFSSLPFVVGMKIQSGDRKSTRLNSSH